MIFLLGALFLVGAASEYQEDNSVLIEATTLYFHERTLTKGRVPKPQLVCRNTYPEDGCTRRRVVFAECHREPDSTWLEWECTGHGGDGSLASAGLELKRLAVVCTSGLPESCSLTYTLRFDNATMINIEEQKLIGACNELYDAGRLMPTCALERSISFALGMMSAFAGAAFWFAWAWWYGFLVRQGDAVVWYFGSDDPAMPLAADESHKQAAE